MESKTALSIILLVKGLYPSGRWARTGVLALYTPNMHLSCCFARFLFFLHLFCQTSQGKLNSKFQQLNCETLTQLLWVTDSWEQSHQHWKDTKLNIIPSSSSHQSPKASKFERDHRDTTACGEEGATLLERIPAKKQACFRNLLMFPSTEPKAHEQKSTLCSTFCFWNYLTPALWSKFLVWWRRKRGLVTFPVGNCFVIIITLPLNLSRP